MNTAPATTSTSRSITIKEIDREFVDKLIEKRKNGLVIIRILLDCIEYVEMSKDTVPKIERCIDLFAYIIQQTDKYDIDADDYSNIIDGIISVSKCEYNINKTKRCTVSIIKILFYCFGRKK